MMYNFGFVGLELTSNALEMKNVKVALKSAPWKN